MDYKRTYGDAFKFYKSLDRYPKRRRMDDETSTLGENHLENEMEIPVQYVPSGSRRTLPAERSIQSYKNHFFGT